MNDTGNPYQLTFEQRPGYIFARVRAATISRAAATRYLTEVAEYCAATGAKRLMLERDIPVMLPDSDLFFTTQDFLAMIGPLKVAFVNPHLSIEKEMEFAITIGTNRGANYNLFHSEAQAERWLMG